jgi:protease I
MDNLINAGVHWVGEEVAEDKGFVTSCSPKDLPVFSNKLIEEIREAG